MNASDWNALGLGDAFVTAQELVSKNLVISYLRRLEGLAPRDNMHPAVYDGRDLLTDVVKAYVK